MKNRYLLRAVLFVSASMFLILFLAESQIIQLLNADNTFYQVWFNFLGIMVICLALWLLSINSFYKFFKLMNLENLTKETERLQFEESQKLIETLRSQRHDYRNQLQVIKVLAQFNKSEEIVKYIQEYDQALDLTSFISTRIENPVISAMFLVFTTEAKEKEIQFNIDSDLDFNHCPLPAVKLTRVLSNIIRNALEILELTKTVERTIQVTMWETKDSYCFIIWNNGPVIPPENLQLIFTPGFSTKNSTGLGLSIVKELTEEMGGKVSVTSSLEDGTEFKIVIPKPAPPAQ
ncbi:MAG: Spo0B domain-containing protein [Firmicutes bacterium]|nr:Spo0B domain-containing protein [Bacillota bacterium]